MAIDKLWKKLYFLSLVKIVFLCISLHEGYSQSQPNILWIVSEDNSPWLGAYGDTIATTPNIDKLAEQGFVYINAYSNAPVCAPARSEERRVGKECRSRWSRYHEVEMIK